MARRRGLEGRFWDDGLELVVGLDEVGRGALAGPVAVGAVILPPGRWAFVDSKALTPKAREDGAREILAVARAAAVGWASNREVDALGINAATRLAAKRALRRLGVTPQAVISDYFRLELGPIPSLHPPGAEQKSPSVAAASILAKVTRDRLMVYLEGRYPGYGFDRHKGYATRAHLMALERLGPSPLHRLTFLKNQGAMLGL